ncbi:hypothetical protein TspCOW1_08860 [Thiohalobacter sp. COW1]|nr:hypothetical protein TspCOW1_08860 [Thiohalobacter sp. COW1]
MAVIDLVDPENGSLPPLAIGTASLSVSSPELNPANPETIYNDGDLSNIPIEILSGTGTPNPMNQEWNTFPAPLNSLEPQPQLQVSVSGTPSTLIGGASFTFSYVTERFTINSFDGKSPRVVATSPDPNIQLSSIHINQGDGTTLIKAIIINPHGFNVNDSASGIINGRSLLSSLEISVMWDRTNTKTPITESNWQDAIQFIGGEFYDIDGSLMPELTPTMEVKL